MLQPNHALEVLLLRALEEDEGSGDHSTLSCIPSGKRGKAVLKIKQAGVLAGMQVAETIFRLREKDIQFKPLLADGIYVNPGDQAFEIEADMRTILTCERVVLNCMQRMSGISSLTRKYVQLLEGFTTRILDTRKTTPNFRLLEKEAVLIGGGHNHRMGLYDMIMLKDNHISYCGGITRAIELAHTYIQEKQLPLSIEVEAGNMEQVREICAVGFGKVFRIMLDNFSPDEVAEAVTFIDRRFETEASGGINMQTIQAYAATGVDYVSVGGLIHQATSIDLSLKAVML
ncbi:MAG: carboxylating nicotinate-nucleotide diphosphorylase [Sediminibacterium sp.]|nr:carboxylating nicotinate-nucleotide diphosphorylase [Sediminibacterium sp.]